MLMGKVEVTQDKVARSVILVLTHVTDIERTRCLDVLVIKSVAVTVDELGLAAEVEDG